MISVGNHKANSLPHYHVPPRVLDYILGAGTVLLAVATWVIGVMQIGSGGNGAEPFSFYVPLLAMALIALVVAALPNRIATKRYYFPEPVHEGNIRTQLFLAHRAFRFGALLIAFIAFLKTLTTACGCVLTPAAVGAILLVLIVGGMSVYLAKAYRNT